jgi:hypothetical protein
MIVTPPRRRGADSGNRVSVLEMVVGRLEIVSRSPETKPGGRTARLSALKTILSALKKIIRALKTKIRVLIMM